MLLPVRMSDLEGRGNWDSPSVGGRLGSPATTGALSGKGRKSQVYGAEQGSSLLSQHNYTCLRAGEGTEEGTCQVWNVLSQSSAEGSWGPVSQPVPGDRDGDTCLVLS